MALGVENQHSKKPISMGQVCIKPLFASRLLMSYGPQLPIWPSPEWGGRVRNLEGMAQGSTEIRVPQGPDAGGSGRGLHGGSRRCLQVVVTCTSPEKGEAGGSRSRVTI